MSMQAMQAIRPLWTAATEGEQSVQKEAGPELPFSDIFQSAIDSVRQTDAAKNEAEYRLATGQLDNPAELTIAATQAAMSVELLVQLRNKALDAYSELMRISM